MAKLMHTMTGHSPLWPCHAGRASAKFCPELDDLDRDSKSCNVWQHAPTSPTSQPGGPVPVTKHIMYACRYVCISSKGTKGFIPSPTFEMKSPLLFLPFQTLPSHTAANMVVSLGLISTAGSCASPAVHLSWSSWSR